MEWDVYMAHVSETTQEATAIHADVLRAIQVRSYCPTHDNYLANVFDSWNPVSGLPEIKTCIALDKLTQMIMTIGIY